MSKVNISIRLFLAITEYFRKYDIDITQALKERNRLLTRRNNELRAKYGVTVRKNDELNDKLNELKKLLNELLLEIENDKLRGRIELFLGLSENGSRFPISPEEKRKAEIPDSQVD